MCTHALWCLSLRWLCLLAIVCFFSLSKVARAIICSLAVVAKMMTYALPILLCAICGYRFIPGPFHFRKFSKLIHSRAIAYMAYSVIMECFPDSPIWTLKTFNYSWMIFESLIMLIMALSFMAGRASFNCPYSTGKQISWHNLHTNAIDLTIKSTWGGFNIIYQSLLVGRVAN